MRFDSIYCDQSRITDPIFLIRYGSGFNLSQIMDRDPTIKTPDSVGPATLIPTFVKVVDNFWLFVGGIESLWQELMYWLWWIVVSEMDYFNQNCHFVFVFCLLEAGSRRTQSPDTTIIDCQMINVYLFSPYEWEKGNILPLATLEYY